MRTRYSGMGPLFARFLGAYFIVSACRFVWAKLHGISPIFGWQGFVASISLPFLLLWVALVFLGLSVLYRAVSKRHPAMDYVALMIAVVLFALCIVWRCSSFYFGVAAAAIAVIFSVYAMGKLSPNRFEQLPDRTVGVAAFGTAVVVVVFLSVTTIANHRNFGTSCFDMGIFVQMFHSLKEHLTAAVTCERAELMSHFRVHSSYIFYLLLPAYALFPRAETLLVLQAVFAVAGVVPLFLIARKHGLKGFVLLAMCLTYVFYGGIVMPCYYEFHENAFLPTILMWLLYAADRKKIPLLYLMAVLTCIVKEDAALYVICIGLFFFFEEKGAKRKHGILLAALAAVYFILTMRWLSRFGDGAFMTSSRFGNLMVDPKDGLWGVIGNVFKDPGYLISLLLQERTLLFFVQTMLPLLFLPFLTKKLHRFWLLAPYAVMNLVIGAGYGYAADINYQYIFGPACLLIYAALKNVGELPRRRRNTLILTAGIVTVVTTTAMASGKWSVAEYQWENKEFYRNMEECMRSVPQDASVLANTYFLPHLADRDQIYMLDEDCFVWNENGKALGMPGLADYDFCVFSLQDPLTDQAKPFLADAGWTVYAQPEGNLLIIYERPGDDETAP